CMHDVDSHPNITDYFKINIGTNFVDKHNNNRQLEYEPIQRLNKGIVLCLNLQDDGSRELLKSILLDEEHHIDWLEAQLHAIKEIGIQNYLAQWMGEASDEKK